ncbi:primase-helicase zinc-binding domain-containing protein [Cupriavidus sp. P-10]
MRCKNCGGLRRFRFPEKAGRGDAADLKLPSWGYR